jgi:hypothetical protein
MRVETIKQVLKKLIGPITPVADATIDSERGENMDTFITLFHDMYRDLEYIAREKEKSIYASEKRLGQKARRALDLIKESFENSEQGL